jgi:exopolysaccharide biosynthesis WecB/TagA/CpsF family protein
MGNPLQEMFLHRNLEATGAWLGVGVGAFFDFTAGTVSRAPEWMNRAGIEWVYRLAQEPGRMWRRYVLGNPEFLWRVLVDRIRSKSSGRS